MKLLAQLEWDVLTDFSEGSLFVEICADCRTVVSVHQQT
jgi:hypothetical protein